MSLLRASVLLNALRGCHCGRVRACICVYVRVSRYECATVGASMQYREASLSISPVDTRYAVRCTLPPKTL